MAIDAGDLGTPEVLQDKKKETPSTVEIEIGGQKFVVNEQMAKAVQAEKAQREGEVRTYLDGQTKRISDEVRAALATRQEPSKPSETKTAGFWDDPEKYFETMRSDFDKKIEERVAVIKNELTTQYTAAESGKAFWDTFYKENSDLANDDFIVKAIVTRDWNDLKDLPGTKARGEIAERARKIILGYTKIENTDESPLVEGGPTPTQKKPEPKQEKVTSLTDILKKQREERRNARHKQSA